MIIGMNKKKLCALVTLSLALCQSVYADAPIFLSTNSVVLKKPPAVTLPDHARRVGRINLNMAALRGVDERIWLAPQLRLRPFDNVDVTLRGVRLEDTLDGSSTWIGHTDAPIEGDAVLTLHNNNLTGRIDIGADQFLINTAIDGNYYVTEIDPSTYSGVPCLSGTDDTIGETMLAQEQHTTIATTAQVSNTIDVLVAYTQQVAAQNALDPASYINNLIADANNSFAVSGINAAYRVVGYTAYAGYQEPSITNSTANAWITLIGEMNSGSAVTQAAYGTGSFAQLKSLRETYAADLVVLLVNGNKLTATCGLSDSIPNAPDANTYSNSSAYVLAADTCATGDRTLTHELGHHLGGRHNWQEANETQGDYDPTIVSAYLGNHGYWYSSPSLSFKTIMAVWPSCGVSGCARINRWSSYNQTYSGVPLGIAPNPNLGIYNRPNDMVSTLSSFAPAVVQYRTPGTLAIPGTPSNFSTSHCNGITTLSWSTTGTVGWFEIYNANQTPQALIYRGGNSTFKSSFGVTTSLNVRACNAATCSGYGSTIVPPTPSGCGPQ